MRTIAALALPLLFLAAANAAPPARDFGFGRQEIYEFKDDSSCLRVKDINADGRADVVFANNRNSRIEVLLRKDSPDSPGLEKEVERRFTDKGFIVDQPVRDLDVADLDGDGLADIVCIGPVYGLSVRYQNKDGSFSDPVTPYLGTDNKFRGLLLEDINHDGLPDILLSRQNNLETLLNQGKRSFERRPPVTYAASSCEFCELADLDGDGNKDLVLFLGGEDLPLRVLPGDGKGSFGWEIPLEARNIKTIGAVGHLGKGKDQLGVVLENGAVFRLLGCAKTQGPSLPCDGKVASVRLPLEGVGRGGSPAWAIGDLDGDGIDDLCVSAPELSQLRVHHGRADGFDPKPETIDTLLGVSKIILSKTGDIYVFSPKEKAIARHAAKALKKFPTLLKTPAKPVAVDCRDGVFLALCQEEGKTDNSYSLLSPEWDANGQLKSETKPLPLTLKNPVTDIKSFRLAPGQTGLICFVSYDKPQLFALKGGALSPLDASGISAFSEEINPRLALPVKDGAADALVVCDKNTARSYRWDDGKFVIVRQFNLANNASVLSGVCGYAGADGKPGALFYDQAERDLVWFPLQDAAAAPLRAHLSGGVKNFCGMSQFRIGGKLGLALLGASEAQALFQHAPALELKVNGEYSTKAEKPSLWTFENVKLGTPPSPKIAALDRANRSVEILEARPEGLRNALTFEVFQEATFDGGKANMRFEPHDIASGDLNGDGVGDLVALSQDKLIIYLGE